jgi:hypothetical protein
MKADTADDVIAFQAWLNQSIRRAWILAFSVAIPGAFLVTLWFPDSGLALVAVALVGIGIGVISDSIEQARKRRREEILEFASAIHEAVQSALATRESLIAEIKAPEEAVVASQLAMMRDDIQRTWTSNVKVLQNLTEIRALLATLATQVGEKGAPFAPPPSSADPYSQIPGFFWKYQAEGDLPLATLESEGGKLLFARPKMPEGFLPMIWFDAKYRQLLVDAQEIARQRGITLSTFLQHLYYIASSTNILARLQKQSEEVR